MSSLNLVANNHSSAPHTIGGIHLANPLVARNNLRNIFALAKPAEIEYGSHYWLNMHDTILGEVGLLHLNVFAGIFCALSPNNTERNNWLDARAIYTYYKQSSSSGTPYSIPYSIPIHTYRHCIKKCDEIWLEHRRHATGRLDYPEITGIRNILNGRKTSSMFMNIIGPENTRFITIDGHMVSCYQGTRLTLDKASISSSVYSVISNVFRQVAEEEYMVPNQLQAVLWLVWRRIHNIPGYRVKDLFQEKLKFD